MAFPVAAAIAGGASLLGKAFNIGRGRRQHRYNRREMEYAHSLNKQMFDYQNAYNTPKNQIARFKEAGLNPALMYGQGNPGNATNYPQVQPTQRTVDPVDVGGIFETAGQVAGTFLQQQQTDNLKAQQKETESRTLLNTIEASIKGGTKEEAKGLIRYQLENLKSDNDNKIQSLRNLKITEGILNANKSEAQIKAENAAIEKAMNQIDLNAMQRSKLSRLDPPIIKLLWRLSEKTKETFEPLLRDIINNSSKLKF